MPKSPDQQVHSLQGKIPQEPQQLIREPDHHEQNGAGPLQGRRKIWEIDGCQCAVIGTCLSMTDLRKIARKTGFALDPKDSDFDIHTRFVQTCKSKNRVSTYVCKTLDRTYRKEIRRFAKAPTAEKQVQLWRESADAGNIPGPLWALVSHAQASSEVLNRVFGEVHMLSHLVGAANRADIRTLRILEERNARLDQALLKSGKRLKAMAREKQDQEKTLYMELNRVKRECADLRQEVAGVQENESKNAEDRLRKELAASKTALQKAENDLALAQRQVAEIQKEVNSRDRRVRHLEDEVLHLEKERSSLENALTRTLEYQSPSGETQPPPGCPLPMLCGRKVLYVGGRTNLVKHYQSLVERMGGKFQHHDGGLECRRCALASLLESADMVLCPVDCVSHDACLRVKRACKAYRKRFLPLRSSGLSSLARSLQELDGKTE